MKKLTCSVLGMLAGFMSVVAVAQVSSNGQPVTTKPLSPEAMEAVKGTPTSDLYFAEDNTGILYTIHPGTANATSIGASGVISNTVGLAPRDPGTLFGSTWQDIVITDATGNDGAWLLAGSVRAEGLAHDCAGTVYGAINGDFFTIDRQAGTRDQVLASGPGNEDFEGIAVGDGGVYGLARFDTDLWFYDPVADAWSVVGDTGISWDLVGLAFDPNSRTLYAKGFQDSDLYTIDPDDGSTSVVGDTGLAEGGGLAWHQCDDLLRFTIPTLQWPGVVALLLLLAVAGFVILRRRALS